MERQLLLREIIREHGLRYIIPLNFQYGFIFSRIFTSTKKIEALKLVLEEFPLNSFVWNMLAVGYREQNEYEKSLQALEKALEINPASAETLDNVGLTHLKMNQFEEAEHAFKRAIDIDRKVSERWINLGIIYLKLNQIDNAVDALRRSLNCKSYKLRKLEQHGESKAVPHLSIKELKDNIPTFNLIFNVDLPKFSWYYLAKAYYKKQEYEKALEACRESLAIDYKFDKVYTLRKKILSAKSSEIRKRNNF